MDAVLWENPESTSFIRTVKDVLERQPIASRKSLVVTGLCRLELTLGDGFRQPGCLVGAKITEVGW